MQVWEIIPTTFFNEEILAHKTVNSHLISNIQIRIKFKARDIQPYLKLFTGSGKLVFFLLQIYTMFTTHTHTHTPTHPHPHTYTHTHTHPTHPHTHPTHPPPPSTQNITAIMHHSIKQHVLCTNTRTVCTCNHSI